MAFNIGVNKTALIVLIVLNVSFFVLCVKMLQVLCRVVCRRQPQRPAFWGLPTEACP